MMQNVEAPELLDKDDGHYGPGVNVYSIRMCQVAARVELFSANWRPISMAKLIRKDTSGGRHELDEGITDRMSDLFVHCWSQDGSECSSFDAISSELTSSFDFF